jgi:carbonic anhydrase
LVVVDVIWMIADGWCGSLAQSVRDDIEILKKNPFIRKELADRAVGFVYDLKSGLLTPVSA